MNHLLLDDNRKLFRTLNDHDTVVQYFKFLAQNLGWLCGSFLPSAFCLQTVKPYGNLLWMIFCLTCSKFAWLREYTCWHWPAHLSTGPLSSPWTRHRSARPSTAPLRTILTTDWQCRGAPTFTWQPWTRHLARLGRRSRKRWARQCASAGISCSVGNKRRKGFKHHTRKMWLCWSKFQSKDQFRVSFVSWLKQNKVSMVTEKWLDFYEVIKTGQ